MMIEKNVETSRKVRMRMVYTLGVGVCSVYVCTIYERRAQTLYIQYILCILTGQVIELEPSDNRTVNVVDFVVYLIGRKNHFPSLGIHTHTPCGLYVYI